MRLMIASKESLRPEQALIDLSIFLIFKIIRQAARARPLNPIDAVYRLACDMHAALPADAADRTIALQALAQRAAQRRFTDDQVEG